jgi:hypothetical protein
MRWRSCRSGPGAAAATFLALAGALTTAAPAGAQSDLGGYCAVFANRATEPCVTGRLVMAGVHPRIGLGLFGGSPVPGTASTLGMRLGSTPRFSVSGRLVLVPVEVPGTATSPAGEASLMPGFSTQGTVGLFSGWSPLPTVGGVLAVDAIVRASWLHVPGQDGGSGGFDEGSAWGLAGGLRVGILRESFTLPGVSITGSYGRSTSLTYVDPSGFETRGRIGDWNATAAATKRIGPVGVTAGAAYDRYTAELDFGYGLDSASPSTTLDGSVGRWSAFTNVSWTFLILHGSLEAGWQGDPDGADLPEAGVITLDFDPPGWWLGAALRLSI